MRVLLLEDNPGDARLISKYLLDKNKDIDLVVIQNLTDVINATKNGYELIITDLGLPDSTGLQTVKTLNDIYPNLPTIVLTGLNDEVTGLEAVKMGAQDYLLKDEITPELLYRVMKYAVERKKTEQQLKSLADTKDKFFSIIAHDLKNPFLGIISYMDYFIQNYKKQSPEDMLRIFEVMLDSSRGTFNMLKNLLNWSRSQTGHIQLKPRMCNLSEIIREQIKTLQSTLYSKEIEIITNIAPDHEVYVDSESFRVVTFNLLTNAIKYSHRNNFIEVSSKTAHNKLRIDIKDHGIGMDKSQIDNLFTLDCYTSRIGTAKERGTGLGLIVCKDFIEMNNGTISVNSKTGKGSTFTIEVPVTDQ